MVRTIVHSVTVFDGETSHPSSQVSFNSNTGLIESFTPGFPLITAALPGDIFIDGTGCTLMPGLIDGHVHVHRLHLPDSLDVQRFLRQAMKCGITTLCDMHCDPPMVQSLRRSAEKELASARQDPGAGFCFVARYQKRYVRCYDQRWLAETNHPRSQPTARSTHGSREMAGRYCRDC